MAMLEPQYLSVPGYVDAGAPVQRSIENLQNTLRNQSESDMALAKSMIDLKFKQAAEDRAAAQEQRVKDEYETANNTQEAAKLLLQTKLGDLSGSDAERQFGEEALKGM